MVKLVTLILGRFSINFRKLLQIYAVMAASIHDEGVLAKSKSQSGLGTMRA